MDVELTNVKVVYISRLLKSKRAASDETMMSETGGE